jgi:hypothetical protein
MIKFLWSCIGFSPLTSRVVGASGRDWAGSLGTIAVCSLAPIIHLDVANDAVSRA